MLYLEKQVGEKEGWANIRHTFLLHSNQEGIYYILSIQPISIISLVITLIIAIKNTHPKPLTLLLDLLSPLGLLSARHFPRAGYELIEQVGRRLKVSSSRVLPLGGTPVFQR